MGEEEWEGWAEDVGVRGRKGGRRNGEREVERMEGRRATGRKQGRMGDVWQKSGNV